MVGADSVPNGASQIRPASSHTGIRKESNVYRYDIYGNIINNKIYIHYYSFQKLNSFILPM